MDCSHPHPRRQQRRLGKTPRWRMRTGRRRRQKQRLPKAHRQTGALEVTAKGAAACTGRHSKAQGTDFTCAPAHDANVGCGVRRQWAFAFRRSHSAALLCCPPCCCRAVAGAAPEQDGEEAAAAQQAAAPKEKTKITAQKFNYMRVSSRTQLSGMGSKGTPQNIHHWS